MPHLLKFLALILIAPLAEASTLVTPVLTPAPGSGPASGSFYNNVSVGVGNLASLSQNPTYCVRTDGGTPGTNGAGTCNALPTFQLDHWAFVYLTGTTVCIIATESGFTDSAMTCGTYSIASLTQTPPQLVFSQPVKITNATGTITNGNPVIIPFDATHWSLFYSQCPSGSSDQTGAICDVLLKTTSNAGQSWTDWPTPTNCADSSPPTGCFFHTNVAWLDLPDGMLLDPVNGVGEVWGAEWNGTNNGTRNGAWFSRTTDKGVHWTTPTFVLAGQTQGFWINPTGTGVIIPSGAPGVTGTCAPGCYLMQVLGTNGQHFLVSSDNGQTWSDFSTYIALDSTEEGSLVWAGGMKLMWFVRASGILFPQGPDASMFSTSSNMGASWSNILATGGVGIAIPANFGINGCSVYTNWQETLARPSAVIDPQDPTKVLYIGGIRAGCNGVSQYAFKAVTVSISSLFNSIGLTFPTPQILTEYQNQTSNAGGVMPHTAYGSIGVIDANDIIHVFERGQGGVSGTGNEDIWMSVLTYLLPTSTTGTRKELFF